MILAYHNALAPGDTDVFVAAWVFSPLGHIAACHTVKNDKLSFLLTISLECFAKLLCTNCVGRRCRRRPIRNPQTLGPIIPPRHVLIENEQYLVARSIYEKLGFITSCL